MKAGGYKNITTKQVSTWIESEEPTALNVLAKACKFNLFKKEGGASKTCYVLSSTTHNNYESALSRNHGDIQKTASSIVRWAIEHPTNPAKEIVTQNGKRLVKIVSTADVDNETQHAIDMITAIVTQNRELKAENELLKEEIERLKKFEDYYKTVKEIKLC